MKIRIAMILTLTTISAVAEEKPKTGPSDKASLSYVSVGGNAEGQTLGFSNEYKYLWVDAGFQFNIGGVRVNNTLITRTALGTETDYLVTETKESRTTAENYYGNLRYDHTITDHLSWFVGAGWQRNIPSGINARYDGLGGLAYFWVKNDRTVFRTDVGVGYQKDDFLIEVPDVKTSYVAGNIVVHLDQKIGTHSQFTSDLGLVENFSESKAWMGTWRNGFTTNLNERLALKIGYDIVYSNRPAYAKVDLFATPQDLVANIPSGAVPYQLKKVDTIFTTSLVINF